MPGTQPTEIGSLESTNRCDNCHGGYNMTVEPSYMWSGGLMAHAGRDPVFWATAAIAEQDFDGAGDLCIRCHSTTGWLAGRSVPTDGSALASTDVDGVDCDFCHHLTHPLETEHPGVMTPPFIANDGTEAYFGSGMAALSAGAEKLGPYSGVKARHKTMKSEFHRDRDFCGTCHDVSNPVTGDLAHNHGQFLDPDPVIASGIPGAPVEGKAAFNNPPYAYGVVERTFSEYKSALISETLVDDYPGLPPELQGGVLEQVYDAATAGGAQSADYLTPSAPRYFSCQTCHMRPVTGKGANKQGVPLRKDLPLHDLTGGNYWAPAAIAHLDSQGKLLLGGSLTPGQVEAMDDAALRATEQLQLAATLRVDPGENEVQVINHTGHKLLTGYPEGRRMWLNVKWYDADGALLREDGGYGGFDAGGLAVETLLDLDGANTRIWEAHMGITQQWAQQLVDDLGYDPGLALAYDRATGAVTHTLGELAAAAPGTVVETFHFVLNNTVVSDNRIPPYGMSYDLAAQRNAVPVPDTLYHGAGAGSTYDHYDRVELAPPAGAHHAAIELLYQPTSWEYVQFLWLANNGIDPGQGGNAFLGSAGDDLLDAWLNTGMAEPFVMASATWGAADEPCDIEPPTITKVEPGERQNIVHWYGLHEDETGYSVYYDLAGKAQFVGHSTCTHGFCGLLDGDLTNGQEYCYKLTVHTEACESDFSDIVCGTPGEPVLPEAGIAALETGQWIKEGKGKNATVTWVPGSVFVQGDEIVFRALVTDEDGTPLPGAHFDLMISGPEADTLSSGNSDDAGFAEAGWPTRKPRKNGTGGTATGAYTATVSGVYAAGYDWDGLFAEVEFSIESP